MADPQVIAELQAFHESVTHVHERLIELDVRSGTSGAANNLLRKLDGAIKHLERGGELDDEERLARNAWMVGAAAASDDGELPDPQEWGSLKTHEKNRWRDAAKKFRVVLNERKGT